MARGPLTILMVLAAAHTATASPVRLQVSGDACNFENLESQLAQMLGADPVDANARASVDVEVTNARAVLEARVSFEDGDGHIRGPRTVTAPNCNDLVESVAVVIATALPAAPSDVATEPQILDAPASAPEPAPLASVASTTAPDLGVNELVEAAESVPPPTSGHMRTDLLAAGAGGLSSNGIDGQVIVGIRLRGDLASISAELRGDAPQQVQTERVGSIGLFRSQLSVSPCLHFEAFAACAIGSIGAIRGSGSGLIAEREAYTPVIATGLRVTWERPLTRRFALRVHVDADALLTTSQFDVDNMKLWVSPRFEASSGLGVLARFP